MKATCLDDVAELLNREGNARYGREAISQFEHALQCAKPALHAGSGPSLIVAISAA